MKLLYVLKEGFLQLFRARALSAMVVLTVASTLLQLSFFIGISKVLENALGSAREKFDMVVFLAPSAEAPDLQRIQDLLGNDPRVDSVHLVTKEEAVSEFRKDPEIDRMLQALGENPLTDSLTVLLRKETTEKLDDLVARLKQDPQVAEVDYGKSEWETMSNLTQLARWVGWILGGFIFLTALFIVSNTLTLALWARREDFLLMKRMGAPGWMRWGPYLWEGLLQGLLGSVIVVGVLESLRRGAGMVLQKYGGVDVLLKLPAGEWEKLYGTLVLLGVILGFFGALMALRKKVTKDPP